MVEIGDWVKPYSQDGEEKGIGCILSFEGLYCQIEMLQRQVHSSVTVQLECNSLKSLRAGVWKAPLPKAIAV